MTGAVNREAGRRAAVQILARQRSGPMDGETFGRYVADSVLSNVLEQPDARLITCARCGAEMLAQVEGNAPGNGALEVCSRCMIDLADTRITALLALRDEFEAPHSALTTIAFTDRARDVLRGTDA